MLDLFFHKTTWQVQAWLLQASRIPRPAVIEYDTGGKPPTKLYLVVAVSKKLYFFTPQVGEDG